MKTTFRRILIPTALVLLCALLLVGAVFQVFVRRHMQEQAYSSMESTANTVSKLASAYMMEDSVSRTSFFLNLTVASQAAGAQTAICDKNGVLIEEDQLKRDTSLYAYLTEHKEKLLSRSNEKDPDKYWYAFGRSQAISDTFCEKMAINSLLRNEADFKFTKAPCGTGVYGGLYIISKTIPLETVSDALKTKEFFAFVMLLGKYKSGGYYTFSSKDVKKYLDYKFADNGGLLC